MTPKQFADSINNQEYPFSLTKEQAELARKHKLLVVYGASDDLCELEGIVSDEVGAGDKTELFIDQYGLQPEWEDDMSKEEARRYFMREKLPGIKIVTRWCKNDVSWTYETTADDYATFAVMEEGEIYCIGLVIDCSKLF